MAVSLPQSVLDALTDVEMPKRHPSRPPREWVERVYNLRSWTEMKRGGHFAAMEQPEALAEDIRDFFRPLRKIQK